MSATAGPVRIFVGADPSQRLALKVLEYSVRRHSTLPVEFIPIVEPPEPGRHEPRQPHYGGLGLSCFAIPRLAGHSGRALHLEAGMLVLQDIAALWALPFEGAKVIVPEEVPQAHRLAGGMRQGRGLGPCPVMLLDCGRLDWEPESIMGGLDGANSDEDLVHHLRILDESEVRRAIPLQWSSPEACGPETSLIHYMDPETQPWISTDNENGWIWLNEAKHMLQAGALRWAEIEEGVRLGHLRPSILAELGMSADLSITDSRRKRFLDRIDANAGFVRPRARPAVRRQRAAAQASDPGLPARGSESQAVEERCLALEQENAEAKELLRHAIGRAERSEKELARIRNSIRYRAAESLAGVYAMATPGFLRRPGRANRAMFGLARWAYRRLAARRRIAAEQANAALEVSTESLAEGVPLVEDKSALASGYFRNGDAALPPVTVIVPIFNAPEYVCACVDSVLRHLGNGTRVVLIDDASTDPAIADLLSRYERDHRIDIRRNEKNLGYTRTINRGLSQVETDVILLNSDTVVGPKWIAQLRAAAYSRPNIATVTPLSDNAGAFSAPIANAQNPLTQGRSADEIARLVNRTSLRLRPETPTGNGFCIYIRHAAIRAVGLFDDAAFPTGYGEENDFCMRARSAGWLNIVDDATYVLHARSKSFGKERKALLAAGRRTMDERYPEYGDLVRVFLNDPAMRRARATVGAAFEALGKKRRPALRAIRPRVLTVLHDSGGGTPQTSRDLATGLGDRYDSYLFMGDGSEFRLYRRQDDRILEQGQFLELERHSLARPVDGTDFSRADYREMVWRVLTGHDIDLLHVRHLFGHSFDLPQIARDLAIPVIVSLHDYYLACPTVQLLDDADRFCGGRCSDGHGRCPVPTHLFRKPPPLKHRWVHVWRDEVRRRILRHATTVVTTSESAAAIFRDVYGDDLPHVSIIEHGRDLVQHRLAQEPQPDRPMRVLILGNLTKQKGGDLLRQAVRRDREGRFEFHILGDSWPEYRQLGTWHGPYERERLADDVATIRPSVIALLSIWAETYCHTLSEAWSLGIPVVASDIGALGERIRRHGGGWLVDPSDPADVHGVLCRIAADPAEYERQRAHASIANLRTIEAMSADYDHLYSMALAGTGPGSGRDVPDASRPASPRGRAHIS